MSMSIKTLAVIIVSIMVFIIMLFAINLIVDILIGESSVQSCRMSVIKASTLSKVPSISGDLKAHSYADCPRIDLGYLDLPERNTEMALGKILVDEMRDCWYKFGEGNLNPLPGDIMPSVRCYICSTFKSDRDFENVDLIIDDHFKRFKKDKDYLEDALIYNYDNKKNLYYYNQVSVPNILLMWFSSTKYNADWFNIKKDRNYHLVNIFIISKEIMPGSFFMKEHNFKSTLGFVEDRNIAQVCGTLEN